jgi:hypothetical protein
MRDLKTLAHEAQRGPIGHGDLTAALADAKHFGGNPLGTWSKHRPEHREDNIEGVIGKGEVLGITFFEMDIQILIAGALPGLRKKIGSDIDASDRGSGARRWNRRIARATPYIEQPAAGLDWSAPDKVLGCVGDESRDAAEVPGHPTGFHAGLYLRELKVCG